MILDYIKYKNYFNNIECILENLDKKYLLPEVIEDNGVGIIDRDISRVLEKEFTGENGRIFGKSTGIGLYLCKKLCAKLGLGLKLESKENKGTKATITFPECKFIEG